VLEVDGEDVNTFYVEPEEFCMLTVIGETLANEMGLFTYFNKSKRILYTGFAEGSTGFKDAEMLSRTLPAAPKKSYKLTDMTEEIVREQFGKSVGQYARTVELRKSRKPKSAPQDSREGSPFDVLRNEQQSTDQTLMRDWCRLLRRSNQRDPESEYVEVDFRNMKYAVKGGYHNIFDNPLEIRLKTTGNTEYHFSLRADKGLDAVIIAGDFNGGGSAAFLVVKQGDGEERIYELEWFSVLSVYYKRKGQHLGFYTAFNRRPNVLYCDYCEAYLARKLCDLDKYNFFRPEATTSADSGYTKNNGD